MDVSIISVRIRLVPSHNVRKTFEFFILASIKRLMIKNI